MSTWIDVFSALFDTRKKKKYYKQHSWFVNWILVRYQENTDNTTKLLIDLFKNVLSLREYDKTTREQLRTMAVKNSLKDILAPKDIQTGSDLVVSNEEVLVDVSKIDDTTLIRILSSLPVEERAFYNALVIDNVSADEVSRRTWYSVNYIEYVVKNAKNLLAKKIATQKVAQ